MTAQQIIQKYISFFEKKGHKRIANSPLVLQNDPTTLFTSSGMQPLVPYLLGEPHPQGKRLVNVQNSFRAQDIDEVGDNRHTTFFRMLGNWSLGDYLKKEQIPWIWEFVTKELGIPADKLYVTVFKGYKEIPKDTESEKLWTDIFTKEGLNPKERIFFYDKQNWWSRAGEPDNTPIGEPGGPDSEIFYHFGNYHTTVYGSYCHPNCQCGSFMEIVNSVFMEYKKSDKGFVKLPQQNVDHGAGVERLMAATEGKQDIFRTSLFLPIVQTIEMLSNQSYSISYKNVRIMIAHLTSSIFIISSGVKPSNKEQGSILRRLIRRALDNYYLLGGEGIEDVINKIVEQYKNTDPYLVDQFEAIKNSIIEEMQVYEPARTRAQREYLSERYPLPGKFIRRGDEIMGEYIEITPRDAFNSLASYGTAPIQLESLGYKFDRQGLAEEIKRHQQISRAGAAKKFAGGLADHSEKTIRGHTATHLLHQALRDVLGNHVFQTGSNITSQRIRFDFNYDKSLTDEQLKKVEEIVNQKIRANLPVHFEMIPLRKAKEIGAIGLFDDKYADTVKIYFIGPKTKDQRPYSIEFCGGPHVEKTSKVGKFSIIKQENIGKGIRRVYSKIG